MGRRRVRDATLLHRGGADVPQPIAQSEQHHPHGVRRRRGRAGADAQRTSAFDPDEARDVFERSCATSSWRWRATACTATSRPYNVLYCDGEVRIIDFPQAVDARFNSERPHAARARHREHLRATSHASACAVRRAPHRARSSGARYPAVGAVRLSARGQTARQQAGRLLVWTGHGPAQAGPKSQAEEGGSRMTVPAQRSAAISSIGLLLKDLLAAASEIVDDDTVHVPSIGRATRRYPASLERIANSRELADVLSARHTRLEAVVDPRAPFCAVYATYAGCLARADRAGAFRRRLGHGSRGSRLTPRRNTFARSMPGIGATCSRFRPCGAAVFAATENTAPLRAAEGDPVLARRPSLVRPAARHRAADDNRAGAERQRSRCVHVRVRAAWPRTPPAIREAAGSDPGLSCVVCAGQSARPPC